MIGLDGILFRRATLRDADIVAGISRASRTHFLPYLPDLHTAEGDRRFYRNRVFADCEVWLAEDEDRAVGFCAFKANWVDHLYLLPSHVGRSIGTTLLDKAKEQFDHLQLWVFQRNAPAIQFYERNGFLKVKETDGASNEENTPDALYEWHRMGPDNLDRSIGQSAA